MKIIGLCGHKYAGKDTSALLIARWLADRCLRCKDVAFADPGYAAISAMFQVPEEGLRIPSLKETPRPQLYGATVRRLMQTLLTEWGRTYVAPDVWTLVMRDRIEQIRKSRTVDVLLVTDTRLSEEANMLRSLGSEIWRIKRPGIVAADAHSSETEIDFIAADVEVINDSTIEALGEKLKHALVRYVQGQNI